MAAICPICRHTNSAQADVCVRCERFRFRASVPHAAPPDDDGRVQFDMTPHHSGAETENTLIPHTLRLLMAAEELGQLGGLTSRIGESDDSPTAPM